MNLKSSKGYVIIRDWLAEQDRQPFAFQEECWQQLAQGKSGLVNAPTGCGKTFSVFLGALIDFINHHPQDYKKKGKNGLQLLWITPLRALAKDIGRAMEEVITELGMNWKIGIRNGDTDSSERARQKKQMPEILIITPESLHLLLAQKDYPSLFTTLKIIAVDEWHELLGSKRGVQVELAISRIVGIAMSRDIVAMNKKNSSQLEAISSKLSIWGISATIGNLEEAKEVLLSSLKRFSSSYTNDSPSPSFGGGRGEASITHSFGGGRVEVGEASIIRSHMQKRIEIESIIPDEIEKYPWAGHLGIKLAEKIIPIIEQSRTTLVFINTRGMSEIWYHKLLDIAPQLAGAIALHHGSIDMELRNWVEENLHTGLLKAVVCTASLDLGVDFRPVETVIQVGSPKGVARFLQRAGRSGHSPDAISKIYFLPTHSLELLEAAALKSAIEENLIESRTPMLLSFDVLIQYLNTLAISEGFIPAQIFQEIKSTYCYSDILEEEWEQLLHFITEGGNALQQYDDYRKVEIEEGVYKIKNRRIAMRHRLHIGTIVSESMMKVRFMSGGYIGVIEEWFISRLEPGDVFSLAGRNLEFVMIKEMTVYVRKSNKKKSMVPSWQGGRMPLSANLGRKLRETLNRAEGRKSEVGGRKSEVGSQKSEVGSQKSEVGSQKSEVGGRKSEVGSKKSDIIPHTSDIIPHTSDIIPHTSDLIPHTSDIIPHELKVLEPLFKLQQQLSHVPRENELLIEQIETSDGFHLFVYPFEGRLVHEAMAAILAYRISRITPITFSFAMNDYGFELLSDQPIPVDDSNVYELFSPDKLLTDIQRSVNSTEMARRKFRDIAVIGGLIFQGFPGEKKKARHLQASASLLFNVFSEYEPQNLLLRQSYQEVLAQQMEETRLRDMLHRIQHSNIILRFPERLTPFCFPIKVDSMREDLSSEKLEDRVRKMQQQLER